MYIRAPLHIYVAWCLNKHRETLYIHQSIGCIMPQPGFKILLMSLISQFVQSGSNMTGTELYVNKPHCAAAVRP